MSIWNKVLEQIEQKLSAPSYDTWLKNTVLLPFDEDTDTLIITTENEFGRDWLESRYADLISQTLFEITGKNYKLHFEAQINCNSNELALVQNMLQNKRLNPGEDKLELIQRQLEDLQSIKKEILDVKFQFNNHIDQIEAKISTLINTSVQLIEENEPKNILAMIKDMNNKVDQQISDIDVLNTRLFKVESMIAQLTNK